MAAYGSDQAASIECRAVQIGVESLNSLLALSRSSVLISDVIDVLVSEWISESGDAWSAVCTSVPGNWLRELHETYGADQLFAGNIRDYLGRRRSDRNINFRIEKTAENQPRDFWAFNNGITGLVHELIPDESASTLQIRGLTIVNGAQATGALAAARSADGVSVLARFVQVTDDELVESIISANNTQNAIRASDFRSNDPHQERLRAEFSLIPGAHYAGARRGEIAAGAAAAGDLFIGSDQGAQALAAFHGQPERAYHGKSKIWEEDVVYAQIFGDHTSAEHIVYVVSLHHAIVAYKRALREKESRTAQEDGVFEFLSQRGAVFVLMAALGRCQEIILDRSVADSFNLSFGTLVSPAIAEEHWLPLVESLVSFHETLQPAAEPGRIRVKSVREDAIRSFTASVQAVRGPLSPSFGSFESNVVTSSSSPSAD